MGFAEAVVIIIGLCVFEVISSIDNAVINADVLQTMSKKARRWFLSYGIFIAVFVVRGILPLLIVYFATPHIGLMDALTATFKGDPAAIDAIETSKPILLAGGGVYLVFLFLYWLFVE